MRYSKFILRLAIVAITIVGIGWFVNDYAGLRVEKASIEMTGTLRHHNVDQSLEATVQCMSLNTFSFIRQGSRTLAGFNHEQVSFAPGLFISPFLYHCFKHAVVKNSCFALQFELLVRKIIFPYHHFW